jgi:hypothetical protein
MCGTSGVVSNDGTQHSNTNCNDNSNSPVLALTMLLSLSVTISTFAQETPYSKEHMAQHDGGDRAEYLQEMGNSDPSFYVPPTN